MAILFPDSPITTSPEVAKFYRLLRALPDADYAVWHRLTIHPTPGPDFWILHREQRALWLKISTLNGAEARTFEQAGLFAGETARPVAAEHHALTHFALAHFPPAEAVFFQQIPAWVAFPNLSSEGLSTLEPLAQRPDGMAWVGRETLTTTTFPNWVAQHLGPPLPPETTTQLRQAFTPEVIIPAHFTVRSAATPGQVNEPRPIQRYTAAQATPFLLDYDQERVLKTDLDLSAEASATVKDFNLRLINGVAGSGKSLVVVYRAHLLRQLYPEKAILGLTHNRPLINDLRARYASLSPGGKAVKWQTFYQWCRALWPKDKDWRDPLGQPARERLIETIWHTHLADTTLSARALLDELDWCKDRLIFSLEDYLGADRTGRGFALTEAQRQRMFAAFEAYRAELQKRKAVDWGDVPRQLWRWLEKGQWALPQYDVILIDEAQFFAPIWFELIKRAVKPGVGHLFLVADPTQGFLKRKQSWAASGLEVRGRVHRLKKSYRTTREILNFATLLYRSRLPDDDDDIVPPDLLNMPAGLIPTLIPLTSAQDEITRIVNEIEQLLAQGVPKRHLLVIHAHWTGQERVLERLQAKFGAQAAYDPHQHSTDDAIRVCTLNAATGLESPIVFLAGAHELFEQEQSLRLADDERRDLVRDNTRKLYMALTRAGQRLLMTYVGELPEWLKQAGNRNA